MDELRAKDVLHELRVHRSPGELVTRTVGARAWQRPRWAPSPRIFQRHRLGDPWDPAGTDDVPIGLGPVSLRVGAERRQPAPHAQPKAPAQAAQPQRSSAEDAYERFRSNPPRVPVAKPTAQAPPPQSPPQPELAGAAVRALRGKLPVRPDLDKPEDGPLVPGASPRPQEGANRPGRFAMRASETRAPIVKDLSAAAAEEAPTEVEDRSEVERTRVERSLPRGASLDDLFGFAGGAPRLKIPKEPTGE